MNVLQGGTVCVLKTRGQAATFCLLRIDVTKRVAVVGKESSYSAGGGFSRRLHKGRYTVVYTMKDGEQAVGFIDGCHLKPVAVLADFNKRLKEDTTYHTAHMYTKP